MNDHGFDSDEAIAAVLHRARSGLAPTTSERAATLERLSATLVGAPSLTGSSRSDGPSGPNQDAVSVDGGTLGHAALGGATLGRTIAAVFLAGLAVGGGIGFGGGYWARSPQLGVPATGVVPGAPTASATEGAYETASVGVTDVVGRNDSVRRSASLHGAETSLRAGFAQGAGALERAAATHAESSRGAALDHEVTVEPRAGSRGGAVAEGAAFEVEALDGTPATDGASADGAARSARIASGSSQRATARAAAPSIGRRERRKSAEADRATSASLASDDEVAFVRRAQKALRNGDAAWALALMRTLDEQLPRGALLTERNVTRVLALCQMGRTDEARAVAERTLRGDRGSGVYASRLAASCVGSEDSTSEQ